MPSFHLRKLNLSFVAINIGTYMRTLRTYIIIGADLSLIIKIVSLTLYVQYKMKGGVRGRFLHENTEGVLIRN